MRYLPQYRDTKEAIENIRLLAPSGERVSLAQLCKVKSATALRRFIAKGISATSRSSTACAGATWAARWKRRSQKVNADRCSCPRGYHIDWAGEYESQKRAEARLLIIVPLTLLLIFMILYTMFVARNGRC